LIKDIIIAVTIITTTTTRDITIGISINCESKAFDPIKNNINANAGFK
jgi:hypothetical protein